MTDPRPNPVVPFRVGLGTDRHRLESGGPLILGGVAVPAEVQAVGHSDADALLHAVADAMLGAAGLGDIGEQFPDTDPAFAGADSADLLTRVVAMVTAAGWRVVNVDCAIHLQRPRLAPHKPAIRARVAELLRVDPGAVGIKAKTGENLGPVGRGEAIDTLAVALLAPSDADAEPPNQETP
jgi:2-C-methyl-D-erythritol 2,4-cyclodiphosphate synthase